MTAAFLRLITQVGTSLFSFLYRVDELIPSSSAVFWRLQSLCFNAAVRTIASISSMLPAIPVKSSAFVNHLDTSLKGKIQTFLRVHKIRGRSGGNGHQLIIPLKEAATILSTCRQTLMEYAKRGDIPYVKMSRKAVYFRPEVLERFIEKRVVRHNPTKIPKPADVN